MVFQNQWDELRTVYWVSGTFRLPSILSAYALSVQARATFSVLHWPSFSQSVSLKNIVPDDSEFMKACDAGNYESARNIALDGKGSPTDIDKHGQPALHVSERAQSIVENAECHNRGPSGVVLMRWLGFCLKMALAPTNPRGLCMSTCRDDRCTPSTNYDKESTSCCVQVWTY